jgi:hypothetical protein
MWSELIGEVNLRPFVTEIFDQNGVGSCATESTSQAIQIIRAFQGQDYVQLAPWSLYAFTSGGRDRGSVIGHNLQRARDVGILPMRLWPRSKGWSSKPDEATLAEAAKYRIHEYYDCGSIDEIGSALLKGWPVVFGWKGHSVVFTELVDTNRARYANSWGSDWDDNGFGLLDLSEVNFSYGAFAVCTTIDAGE